MWLPPGLAWLQASAEGRSWIDSIPGSVEACAQAWALRLGRPYPDSCVSLVLPVERADGTPAVLKVQFPHRECEHEAVALWAWDGEGTVRLLAHDSPRHALLLERCTPGTHLRELRTSTPTTCSVPSGSRGW
jgi:streptomycin 6-kinase